MGRVAVVGRSAACQWKLPGTTNISQRNGYSAVFTYNRTRGAWVAKYGTHNNFTISSEVEFTSVTPRLVRFIITWTDERSGLYTGTGIYTGTIDRDGFVTGTTRDRFNSRSKASWYMTAPCALRVTGGHCQAG